MSLVGRISRDSELPELPENRNAKLVFTTIHTWWARRRQARRLPFWLVVVDEVHWGEDGPLYTELRRAYQRKATFLGMTATARAWTDYETVFGVDFDS